MVLSAWLLFSFIDTSAKWLVLAGLPAIQLAFMRYAGHFALSLATILAGGASWQRFGTDRLGLVVLRAALLISSTCLNFYILRFLPLTVTSAIMFSAPLIVTGLAVPLLGERVGVWRMAAILVGFVGVLIVIRPFDESFHWAMLLALWNAFALGLYSVLTRKLSGIVASETMQFYSGALGTLVLFPFAVWAWQAPASTLDWALLVGLGVWGWAGHELLTRAHGFAGSNALMPFTYSFLIYLTISSWLVFDHLPDRFTLLGASIIVLSGLVIWARERRREVVQ